jgi:hypothetical protein
MEAQLFRRIQLLPQLGNVYDFTKTHRGCAIEERKSGMHFGKQLPDQLEHQQFVKIGIQQGTRNGIQIPVMIVRTSGNIDDHNVPTLLEHPPAYLKLASS